MPQFKVHTPLVYTQRCICLLHNVTGNNAVPYHSHASRISNNSDSNSKSSDTSLSRNATSDSDKSSKSQQQGGSVCLTVQ